MTDYTTRDAAGLCADATREANVALQLNPNSVEAYLALAMAATNAGDERGAVQAFERTLALNPGHSTGQFWYGFFLANLGRVTEAVQRGEKAIQIDPLSTIVHANLSYWYLRAGNPDAAARQLKHAFALDPNFLPTIIYAFVIAEATGRYAEAADQLKRVLATNTERTDLWLDLFRTLYHADRYEEAVAALEAWLSIDSLSHLRGTFSEAYRRLGIDAVVKRFGESLAEPRLVHRQLGVISLTLIDLGFTDAAFRWLEYSFEHDRHELLRIRLDHFWDPVRDDPRFVQLVRKLDSSTGK
jgi:Tfp pilus assembly protein PilF